MNFRKTTLSLLVGLTLGAMATAQAADIDHVLLISVDGLHALDVERYVQCAGPGFSGHEFGVEPCHRKGVGNAEEEGCRWGCGGLAGRSA
jgi:hypothetical protein